MTVAADAPLDQEDEILNDEERGDLAEADPDVEKVSYSGSDFDVEGLVRRLDRGDVIIPNFGTAPTEGIETASFQRGFVWRKPQMDKFIESLLLGYPIPGIMLVQQLDKRYLVLDGQQRLTTLRAFYSGIHDGKEFALENVADDFRGFTYRSLPDELRRTLNNTFIQATIVKTDGTKESLEAIYQVFERLNSGGTQLTAHEIRLALFPGKLVNDLNDLNKDQNWRAIYGQVSPRRRDHELLLRVFALFTRSAEYRRPLKKFLNDFVADHREVTKFDFDHTAGLFRRAAKILADAGARNAFRPTGRLNAALLEVVFVAAMKRVSEQKPLDHERVAVALSDLSRNSEMLGAVSGSTAAPDNLRLRLQLADMALAEL